MLEGHSIICFAPSDWWAMNPSCTTHIMQHLSETNKILYINPFSSDVFGAKKSGKKRGLRTRITRKFKSLIKLLKRVDKNLYVFSPFFIPVQGRPFVDSLNNFLLKLQIKTIGSVLKIKRPILWMENARAADTMEWFVPELVVYHVSDLFSSDGYTSNAQKQKAREALISQRSDLVICVSRELRDMKAKEKSNVHYIPHGVDYQLFRQAVNDQVLPEELREVPKPIIGYYGTMTANNDIAMMEYCASQLPHMSFVFGGQITTGDYSRLAAMDNVFLLGRIPYEKIPALCAGFDVCMLQWRMSEWIRKCNPLKMLEYMAAGKPIVSVEIEEACRHSDVISIAGSKEEFCQAIEWELHNDTEDRRKKRIAIAADHDWQRQVQRISEAIESAIAEKRHPVQHLKGQAV